MTRSGARVAPGLLTDLYQLTMAQAYVHEDMHEPAVFSLFVRRLPPGRNFLLACGLDDALRALETIAFDDAALAYLASLGRFSDRFLGYLADVRFRGDVRAVPEGMPVFANEPLLEITAPIAEAQLAETMLINVVHLQTLLASKAARVVLAAGGRAVVDFGMRRMHGLDAASQGARSFAIAGVTATSNVAAGFLYDLPVAGTVAHSYIQAHDDELDAFRAFATAMPETTLLVDTYDTLAGVRKVVALARELGDRFTVRAIRIDSGDLGGLARAARAILDEAGLQSVRIVASGNLDEHAIAELLAAGAPIDAFGVGTQMGVSADAPSLDIAYKLVAYAGRDRTKLSAGKVVLPGSKQVFRRERDGTAIGDLIARVDEHDAGRPLLREVMRAGERTAAGREDLTTLRARAAEEIARLPAAIRQLEPADPPYPVEVSDALRQELERMRSQLG